MQKQASTMSNASEASRGGKGGRGGRRNTTDNAAYQAKAGQKDQPKAEPIKVTEEQLQTKIQVVFKKFVKGSGPADDEEEEKTEEGPFQAVKDLLARGSIEKEEDGKAKKVFIEDITSALFSKFLDMDLNEISQHFVPFMSAWIEAGTVSPDKWKFVVKRAICELENQVADMPAFPLLLAKGLILPLIAQGSLRLGDLEWYKDEDKDELFDLRGQYQVAAAILDGLATNGPQPRDELASAFKSAHGVAFSHMKSASEENNGPEELTEIKETWIEENCDEANREFIISTLGLE